MQMLGPLNIITMFNEREMLATNKDYSKRNGRSQAVQG